MATTRTEITEITTGLAMLGYQDLDRALEVRPRHITHVDEAVFERLESARASGSFEREFSVAWANGESFARSSLGLRGRPPWSLEWKGPHRPASRTIETVPADLRVDHVFLISCKYRSRILHNSGPAQLFDRCLVPSGPVPRSNWFEEVCPNAFGAVWRPIHVAAGLDPRRSSPSSLTSADRDVVKSTVRDQPVDTTSAEYSMFVQVASEQSARRWRRSLGDLANRSELLWRLLRMEAAPYFVLGVHHDFEPLRYRVSTPWDFSQQFRLADISITAGQRGQPSVDWVAAIIGHDGEEFEVSGHVEVRWSHGRLIGSPEAKVYLDSDPSAVPGYTPL